MNPWLYGFDAHALRLLLSTPISITLLTSLDIKYLLCDNTKDVYGFYNNYK